MDYSAVSDASTPSTKSSAKSSQSGHTLGIPKPPIDPPRRRSSLGFSHIALPNVLPRQTQQRINPESVPKPPALVTTRTSNTGRKRGTIPLHLSSTPKQGHNANMQKIFQDAKAQLQFDMTFASSPGGSIESRLPSAQTPTPLHASTRNVSPRQDGSASKNRDWRYSTAPGLIAQAHIDVREPLPGSELALPDLASAEVDHVDSPAAEPVSSGFNTPEDLERDGSNTRNGQTLPPLPDTSPMTNRLIDTDAIAAYDLSPRPPQHMLSITSLERPLTEMEINRVHQECVDDEDISPAITYLQTQSSSPETPESPSKSLEDQLIFLSTPAKAAAESARLKRGLQRSGHRSTSDKENLLPGIACPDPSVHAGCRNNRCPDPHRHYFMYSPQARMSTPTTFRQHSGHSTPNIHLSNYQPSPSPLRASLYPPAPFYRRADSTGSPLPVLKIKSPPLSPGPRGFHQQQHYYSNGPGDYARPPTATMRPSTGSSQPFADAEHFQPGWYHYPSDAGPPKPKSLTYTFSTAASKVIGSSQAPDLRIRDSYRTDTLTPLAKPAIRFRKNGIGAMVARGAARTHSTANYSPWPPTTGPGYGRPRTAAPPSRHGMTSPSYPRSMSSPPRQSGYSACMPMKRRRPKDFSRDFDIAVDSNLASVPGTPMEIDEDIQAAIRMSITGVPDAPVDDAVEPSLVEVKSLSPNVSPFRKGRSTATKRPRSASYWDDDLPEIRKINQTRMKRPATMQGPNHRVKSMRVSGVRSSPPRHIEAAPTAVVSKVDTEASASIYSQAGLSEISRLQALTTGNIEEVEIEDSDVVMADIGKQDVH